MRLGDPVRLAMTKWGAVPHWEYDATYLGGDDHGVWIGMPSGTFMSRPGASFTTTVDQVTLVPDGWWVATFHAPGFPVRTYVDMTSAPVWDDARIRAIDLDLDVIRTDDGHVFVDDEDEFAEHQVAFGYPPEVVSLAEASCAWVLESVIEERAPFDGDTSEAWLGVLARLRPR